MNGEIEGREVPSAHSAEDLRVVEAENRALRTALDLWETDLMDRLADKIRTDALSQFRPIIENLVRAADSLAKATPDKVLRGTLERFVKQANDQLRSPLLGPPTYPKKEKLREDQRIFQETEQALYREAMRHDMTKTELKRAIEANVKIQNEAYQAGYERAKANARITEAKLLAELAQANQQGLISRHAKGCPHYHNEMQNVFLLSDEDSYDVCTCLKNFVPAYSVAHRDTLMAAMKKLLLEAGDASLGGMNESWKRRKDEVLKEIP